MTTRLAQLLAERLARGSLVVPHAGDEPWPERGGGFTSPVDAAVLVAFVDRREPTLLLTRRQAAMRKHSGQVAFPGGRMDEDDRDLVTTALREAQEEVGLDPRAVQVIGPVPVYATITGYRVTPIIAVIPPDLPLVAAPDEVARLFEVRCDHLFHPARQDRRSVEWEGAMRDYWEIAADGERVWGATAAMIRNIGALLALDVDPAALNAVTVA